MARKRTRTILKHAPAWSYHLADPNNIDSSRIGIAEVELLGGKCLVADDFIMHGGIEELRDHVGITPLIKDGRETKIVGTFKLWPEADRLDQRVLVVADKTNTLFYVYENWVVSKENACLVESRRPDGLSVREFPSAKVAKEFASLMFYLWGDYFTLLERTGIIGLEIKQALEKESVQAKRLRLFGNTPETNMSRLFERLLDAKPQMTTGKWLDLYELVELINEVEWSETNLGGDTDFSAKVKAKLSEVTWL